MRKLVILMYLVVIVGLIYIVKSISVPTTRQPVEYSKVATISSDFNLVNTQGVSVSSKDFLGKMMLVYFGFTYCPDICPAELQKLTNIVELLGDNIKYVQPIFITIDPERDTLLQLKSYMENFSSKILALGGSIDQIKEAASNYRVYYNKTDEQTQNYMIDHSSLIYLIDAKGTYIKSFNIKTPADEIFKYIDLLLKQG